MKRCCAVIIIASWCAALVPVPALSQTVTDPGYDENAFATFQSGAWTATAAFIGKDSYGPEYQCRISTLGATLWQRRPYESGEMPAEWRLLEDERRRAERFEIRWIALNGKRCEVAALPWRLILPPDDEEGIVVMSDRLLLAVRVDPSAPWLPFTYLTLDMLGARSFEIGYSVEIDDQVHQARRRISLAGFREAAKWCGRQLLRDRQHHVRVRALTR